jgi:hypothetical protein
MGHPPYNDVEEFPCMADELAVKVVIKQSVLRGSDNSIEGQRVGVVYINGREYRILAPPEAKGEVLDWIEHLSVRQLVGLNSEAEIRDALGVLALRATKEELEKMKRDANRAAGVDPDGIHCDAQICINGHLQHCDGSPFDRKAHCSKCGAACIDECLHCKMPLRGAEIHKPVYYERPSFCHGCGRPYPWMEDRLRTARELLDHDEKLSLDERNALWNDLQYVMSDPKADLAPAKKKLIDIKLGTAAQATREFFVDLMATIAVKSMES